MENNNELDNRVIDGLLKEIGGMEDVEVDKITAQTDNLDEIIDKLFEDNIEDVSVESMREVYQKIDIEEYMNCIKFQEILIGYSLLDVEENTQYNTGEIIPLAERNSKFIVGNNLQETEEQEVEEVEIEEVEEIEEEQLTEEQPTVEQEDTKLLQELQELQEELQEEVQEEVQEEIQEEIPEEVPEEVEQPTEEQQKAILDLDKEDEEVEIQDLQIDNVLEDDEDDTVYRL